MEATSNQSMSQLIPEPQLISKENLKIYPNPVRRYPGNLTGHHEALTRGWKGYCHGNFLPDRQMTIAFDKNAV